MLTERDPTTRLVLSEVIEHQRALAADARQDIAVRTAHALMGDQ